MKDTFEPVEIDPRDRALLEKIGRLRVAAWATLIPSAAKTHCWLDDFELKARHWCVFHDGEPVAAARLSLHDRLEDVPDAEIYAGAFAEPPLAPIACFSRLVVHPDFRGRGLARRLDQARLAAARAAETRTVIVVLTPDPPDPRLRRFRERGFVPVGNTVRERAGHFLEGVWSQPLVYRFPEPAPPFAFDFENWTAHGRVRDPGNPTRLVPLGIRLLGESELPPLFRLHQLILSRLPHPHVLRPDSEEFMRRNLRERGVTFGVFRDHELIGYSVVAFPAPDKPHPGDDLPGIPMGRDEVAIYDGSGVHADYRRNHLHATLNVLRKEYARRAGRHHLYGTVSIYNPLSLENHLTAGLMVKNIQEKYGGMMRLIIHQDLRETPVPVPGGEQTVRLADVAGHRAALAAGLFGCQLRKDGPEYAIRHARFRAARCS